ncbi:MAG: hypothetical protein KDK97_22770 [Verrucomicrobiales bacterium]|nr:hypothetical protein [Verrucomicrobiales bacterium]MCP5556194.1 hypothetical protein [Verrucomicrobiaceae bacterium]
MSRSSNSVSSYKPLLLGLAGCLLLFGVAAGGFILAGGSKSERVAPVSGSLGSSATSPSPKQGATGRTEGPPDLLPTDVGRRPDPGGMALEADSAAMVGRRTLPDELLIYPGLEKVPSPLLTPKVGVNNGIITGWSSDDVATVIEHYRQALIDEGFEVEVSNVGGESAGSLIGKKDGGASSLQVNVSREEGGRTHVFVQFEEPK